MLRFQQKLRHHTSLFSSTISTAANDLRPVSTLMHRLDCKSPVGTQPRPYNAWCTSVVYSKWLATSSAPPLSSSRNRALQYGIKGLRVINAGKRARAAQHRPSSICKSRPAIRIRNAWNPKRDLCGGWQCHHFGAAGNPTITSGGPRRASGFSNGGYVHARTVARHANTCASQTRNCDVISWLHIYEFFALSKKNVYKQDQFKH